MPDPLTPLQRDLVEEFGSLYESYGFMRLKGLLVGLLLTQSEPVCLDSMTELLDRSKGPISSAVRALADIGLVRKARGPVTRRDYYVAHADLFYNNFKFNMAIVRKNRELAQRMLERAHLEDRAANEAMIENLEHMQTFYTLMESFYEDFAAQWEQVKRQRLQASTS